MALVKPYRFDICLVSLDPTVGSEIKKTRPCVIVSPDELNRHLHTVIVAPMTTVIRKLKFRVPIYFSRKHGEIALDQMRAVDRKRLVKKLGTLKEEERNTLMETLGKLFAF